MSYYLKPYSIPSTFLFKDIKYSLLLTIKYFNVIPSSNYLLLVRLREKVTAYLKKIRTVDGRNAML